MIKKCLNIVAEAIFKKGITYKLLKYSGTNGILSLLGIVLFI